MLLWGRNQNIEGGNIGKDTCWNRRYVFYRKNFTWMRIENVDSHQRVVVGNNPEPPGFEERYFARFRRIRRVMIAKLGIFLT